MERKERNYTPDIPLPTLEQVFAKFPWLEEALGSLKEYDEKTYAHSLRVARLTWLASENKGISETQRLTLFAAGLVHDIGKMGVPVEILNKNGRLSKAEQGVMQEHVGLGVETIRSSEHREVAVGDIALEEIVGAHHAFGGDDSPRPRYGNAPSEDPQMYKLQLILAGSDYADALLGVRPYKPALEIQEAQRMVKEDFGAETRSAVGEIIELRSRMEDK